MFTRIRVLRLVVVAGMASGCTNAVMFATSTRGGVEVTTLEGGQQHASIGWNRFEGITMPVRKKDDSLVPKAFSALSVSHLDTGKVSWGELGPLQVKHVFATGRASAREFSKTSVINSFRAIEGMALVPLDMLPGVSRLIGAVDHANSAELGQLIAAVNATLAGTPVTNRAEAKQRIGDAAIDPGQREKLQALQTKVAGTVRAIEARSTAPGAANEPHS